MQTRRTLLVALTTVLTAVLAVLTPATVAAEAPEAGVFANYTVEVRNLDGRAEVFYLEDNRLWHKWEFTPGRRDFSQPQPLGGSGRLIYDQIAAERNKDGRLVVFGVGTNKKMYHIWQLTPGGDWSAFHSLGGGFDGPPTVAKNQDGRLVVFGVGETGAMYHAYERSPGGPWTGWYNMGGKWILAPWSPEMGMYIDGRLWARHVGANGYTYYTYQVVPNGNWYQGWFRE